MLGSRGRRVGSGRDVGSDGLKETSNVVALCELYSNVEWDPCTLVFAVTTLDLFVNALLDLSLEDTCSLGLVETNDLEDLSSIEPAIGTSSHDGDIVDDALVDWHARVGGLLSSTKCGVRR